MQLQYMWTKDVTRFGLHHASSSCTDITIQEKGLNGNVFGQVGTVYKAALSGNGIGESCTYCTKIQVPNSITVTNNLTSVQSH